MSSERETPAALDATVSAPGVTPPRAARPAAPTLDLAGPGTLAADPTPTRAAAAGSGLQPGDVVGRYVVGETMGTGGMGRVFRAKDPDLGREVAIKVLHAGGEGSGGALERRLLREAQAMATLSHDNLAGVYDIGVSNGRVFVAMELVDGGSLRALIADRARGWRDKLAAVIAAGRGLAAAHSAGVIHRDFKPDNVLIARSGRVKVVDFGLARAEAGDGTDDAGGRGALPADLSANLTQTGALLGTPAYMAPEQHAGRSVDARADQFAFAVTAWEAVYGRRPFIADSYPALVDAVGAHAIVAPPRGLGVPPALEAALRKALAPEPRDRFTSMDALLAAIEHALRPRRLGPWIAGGALVAATAAAIAGYAMTRGRSRTLPPSPPEPPAAALARVARVVQPPRSPPLREPQTTLEVPALDLADLAAMTGPGQRDPDRVVLTRMAQASVVRAHKADVIDCYDRAGLHRAGRLVIELELDPAGKVVGRQALENGLDDAVARCVLAASEGWRFAAAADGKPASVRFPLVFHPPGDDSGGDEDGARVQIPPIPGLPDGLDFPLPEMPAPPVPDEPPGAPAAPTPPTPPTPPHE